MMGWSSLASSTSSCDKILLTPGPGWTSKSSDSSSKPSSSSDYSIMASVCVSSLKLVIKTYHKYDSKDYYHFENVMITFAKTHLIVIM